MNSIDAAVDRPYMYYSLAGSKPNDANDVQTPIAISYTTITTTDEEQTYYSHSWFFVLLDQ